MGGRNPLPREHGSMRGVRQHWYRAEQLCEACRAARRIWRNVGEYASKANGYWGGGRPALTREHGTARGYGQHYYRKEESCEDCLMAWREYSRQRRKGKADGLGDEGERELDAAAADDGAAAASA